jgi:hypothetical protein
MKAKEDTRASLEGQAQAHGNERRAPRRPLVSMAWYRTLPDRAEPAVEGVASSIDLSAGGIGIFTPRPLPVGVLLFLEVAFHRPGVGSVSLIGRIMHCGRTERGTYRVGIQIEVVPPNDRALLERLIEP